jgi:hypothetical protein
MRIISFLDTAEDVPITWSGSHPIRISLVSAPSSLESVVLHTNVQPPLRPFSARNVAFAGHSMAATSIFTPEPEILNVFMLGCGNVTRVPERRK